MTISNFPPQFMNYVLRDNPETGKKDKFPCLPDGRIVDAHTPANHCDLATAMASTQTDGVAFVLTDNDPYFFLDLDDCATADGGWTNDAQAIYHAFPGALAEVSQSGKGLHIIGKCQPHMLANRRNKWNGWLEFYTTGRFIALSSNGLHTIGGQENPDFDWTRQLMSFVPERPVMEDLTHDVDPSYTGPTDDDELISKLLNSRGGIGAAFGGKATVAQLWNADPILTQVYPDAHGDATKFDHSSADAALMMHLAYWTGRDMARMDRLFRRSALMRPKWERDDYRVKTIHDAARMCRNVYDYEKPSTKAVAHVESGDIYMTIPEMDDYFAGCVYVMDQHKVLTANGRMMEPQQFKSYYGGYMFQMNPDSTGPEKNAFIAFTENRTKKFPKVTGSFFNPNVPFGQIIDDEINTYQPSDVVMTEGDVTPFINHLKKLIPHDGDREILIAYMAAVVQHIGVKFRWAPVVQGTEGNGKTFVAEFLAYAVGEDKVHRPNAKDMGEKFNSYIERTLLGIVEEIHMDGRREALDVLKPLVTNDRIEVRAMRTDKRMTTNFTNWFFLTNYQDAILKTDKDRRFAMFFTAQQSLEDIIRDGMGGNYFPDMYAWAHGGGFAAVAGWLSRYPIPDHLNPATSCHRAPHTSSTVAAIQKSAGMIEAEVIEATQDGTPGFKGGYISSFALDRMLKQRHLKLSLNKRGDMLETLGYRKHPALPDGRANRPIVPEEGKRPTIYINVSVDPSSGDPVEQYLQAQDYFPNP